MSSDGILNRFTQALEGIPRMIANALTKRSDDFKTRVESEIDKIVSEFNVEKVVREVGEELLHYALTTAIKAHFKSSSAQQTINDHIDKILIKTATPATPETAIPESTEDLQAPTSAFSDPLTVQDIKALEGDVYVLLGLTPLDFNQAIDIFFQNVPGPERALIVRANDISVLSHGGVFDSFFDPISEKDKLVQGQVGTLYGMEVYSDAFMNTADQFIQHTGLLKKPVASKRTAATQETMAEVPPAD